MDTPKIDVEFIRPFVDGTLNTLKVQCQLEVKPGKPYFKDPSKELGGDIAAVIGLTSKVFSGSIALVFNEATFLNLMEKMIGEKHACLSKELEDGAGELLNIIFGYAKTALNEKNYKIEKAIPTVVRGKILSMKHLSKAPTVVLPFDTDVGPFTMEVTVEGTLIK